jgi:hypothetical protein
LYCWGGRFGSSPVNVSDGLTFKSISAGGIMWHHPERYLRTALETMNMASLVMVPIKDTVSSLCLSQAG